MESVPRRYAIARANRYMVLCKASHNTIYEKQMVIVYTSLVRFDLEKNKSDMEAVLPKCCTIHFSDSFR